MPFRSMTRQVSLSTDLRESIVDLPKQPAIFPAVAAAAAAILLPTTTVHAEAPSEQAFGRKPIYSDLSSIQQPRKAEPSLPSKSSSAPTPTDRLATQIRKCRLFIHAHARGAEDRTNALMSNILKQEQNFTSTIASLAPSPTTGERLMPGALYVLVASMAGSIISRNRNILLRATTPAAIGISAAYLVLPHTMRNVGDLVWSFEEKSEVIAANHLRVRGAAIEGLKQAKIRSEKTREWSEGIVREGRKLVESWVRNE